MPPVSTDMFRMMTSAGPDCVWDALTPTDEPVSYLHGMIVTSEWRPGSVITVGAPRGGCLIGEVLLADRPRRLSYTLGERLTEPSAYVTWQVQSHPSGTVVRLYVDEPDPSPGADLELTWLPVLAALQAQLEHRAPSGPTPAVEG